MLDSPIALIHFREDIILQVFDPRLDDTEAGICQKLYFISLEI